MGRPTALNDALQETIINAIRQGINEKKAASFAGVSIESIRTWRRKGDAALAKKSNERSPTERKYANFAVAIDRALVECSVMMQSVVTGIASYGARQAGQPIPSVEQQRISLTAATWWLSHRERDEYTTRSEITGKDGAPLDLSAADALAIFRELAASYTPEEAEIE
jgi:hypothetical protein